ncbi:proline-rich protein 36-like [Hetaerina americana]|uniref:proline-rich protein 36-like n=1 Tax=Hetaerina americana TaxID=62018 RepID=UPI003A7F2BBF
MVKDCENDKFSLMKVNFSQPQPPAPQASPAAGGPAAAPAAGGPSSRPSTTPDEVLLARSSGFQPYRPEAESGGGQSSAGAASGPTGPASQAQAPPPRLPPHFGSLDPTGAAAAAAAAAAAYASYHHHHHAHPHAHPHGLYPPPPPSHLPHAYRLEEQLYLERCNSLLRGPPPPPIFPLAPPYHPLYGLRYSPTDILPPPAPLASLLSPAASAAAVMHERIRWDPASNGPMEYLRRYKMEEEHRAMEREQEREHERERERERERDKERDKEKERRASSGHNASSHSSMTVPSTSPSSSVAQMRQQSPADNYNMYPDKKVRKTSGAGKESSGKKEASPTLSHPTPQPPPYPHTMASTPPMLHSISNAITTTTTSICTPPSMVTHQVQNSSPHQAPPPHPHLPTLPHHLPHHQGLPPHSSHHPIPPPLPSQAPLYATTPLVPPGSPSLPPGAIGGPPPSTRAQQSSVTTRPTCPSPPNRAPQQQVQHQSQGTATTPTPPSTKHQQGRAVAGGGVITNPQSMPRKDPPIFVRPFEDNFHSSKSSPPSTAPPPVQVPQQQHMRTSPTASLPTANAVVTNAACSSYDHVRIPEVPPPIMPHLHHQPQHPSSIIESLKGVSTPVTTSAVASRPHSSPPLPHHGKLGVNGSTSGNCSAAAPKEWNGNVPHRTAVADTVDPSNNNNKGESKSTGPYPLMGVQSNSSAHPVTPNHHYTSHLVLPTTTVTTTTTTSTATTTVSSSSPAASLITTRVVDSLAKRNHQLLPPPHQHAPFPHHFYPPPPQQHHNQQQQNHLAPPVVPPPPPVPHPMRFNHGEPLLNVPDASKVMAVSVASKEAMSMAANAAAASSTQQLAGGSTQGVAPSSSSSSPPSLPIGIPMPQPSGSALLVLGGSQQQQQRVAGQPHPPQPLPPAPHPTVAHPQRHAMPSSIIIPPSIARVPSPSSTVSPPTTTVTTNMTAWDYHLVSRNLFSKRVSDLVPPSNTMTAAAPLAAAPAEATIKLEPPQTPPLAQPKPAQVHPQGSSTPSTGSLAVKDQPLQMHHPQPPPPAPPPSPPLMSKLDLAEKRRKDRRMRRTWGSLIGRNASDGGASGGCATPASRAGASSPGSRINGTLPLSGSESELDWDSDGGGGGGGGGSGGGGGGGEWVGSGGGKRWCSGLGGNGLRSLLATVVLTKGPPAQLDASPRKLAFLKIFGLTTLKKRDDLELAKCERRFARHWERVGGCPPPTTSTTPPTTAEPGKTNEREASAGSLLPYPPATPDSLLRTADYSARVRFLTSLELESVPRSKREDMELIWQAIVEERIRRNSINSVVLYSSGLIAESAGSMNQTFMGPYLTRGTSRGNGCVDLRGKSRKRLRDGSFLAPKASLIRGYQLRNGSQSPSESMLSVSDATLIHSKGYLHGGYNHHLVPGLNHYHRVPHGHSYQQLMSGPSQHHHHHQQQQQQQHHHNSLLHSPHHPSHATHVPPTKVPKYPHLPLQVPISANPLLHNGLKAGHDGVTKMAVKREATDEDLDVDDDNEDDFEDEDELGEEDEECEGVKGGKRVEGRFRGGRVTPSAAKSFKWPGMEEVMEAYQRYSQERTMEREILGQQVRRLVGVLGERKAEADALERRLRELLAKRTLHDQQRHRTQAALDHLHACLRALR